MDSGIIDTAKWSRVIHWRLTPHLRYAQREYLNEDKSIRYKERLQQLSISDEMEERWDWVEVKK